MKFKSAVAALVLSILIEGCASGSIGVRAGSSSTTRGGAPPGTYTSSAVVRVDASPNAYFSALFLGTAMLGLHSESQRSSGGMFSRRAPEMAEGRAIAERDCSQPLGDLEANLRCK